MSRRQLASRTTYSTYRYPTRELQCAEYSLEVRFNTIRTSSTRTLPKSQVSNSSTGGSTITSTDGEELGEMFPSENCREAVARDTTNESHRDRTAESRASPQNLTTMQFPYHGLGGTVDLRFCNSTLPYRCSLGSSPTYDREDITSKCLCDKSLRSRSTMGNIYTTGLHLCNSGPLRFLNTGKLRHHVTRQQQEVVAGIASSRPNNSSFEFVPFVISSPRLAALSTATQCQPLSGLACLRVLHSDQVSIQQHHAWNDVRAGAVQLGNVNCLSKDSPNHGPTHPLLPSVVPEFRAGPNCALIQRVRERLVYCSSSERESLDLRKRILLTLTKSLHVEIFLCGNTLYYEVLFFMSIIRTRYTYLITTMDQKVLSCRNEEFSNTNRGSNYRSQRDLQDVADKVSENPTHTTFLQLWFPKRLLKLVKSTLWGQCGCSFLGSSPGPSCSKKWSI
ncbi:hypothetical protein QX201_002584 [Fusarium graminearum]